MLDFDVKNDQVEDTNSSPKKSFFPAPDVEETSKRLIAKYHTHLREAKISYIFRDGKWEKEGRPVMGDAKVMTPYHHVLTGFDFGIIVNYRLWLKTTEISQKEAIVDHLLAYCGYSEDKNNNRKWKKMKPTIAEFPEIVARHGTYTEDVEELANSLAEFEKDNAN